MKTNFNIIFLVLLLPLLGGCSSILGDDFEEKVENQEKKAQVVLTLSVPVATLPSATRGIENDEAINTFTLWAFDNQDRFLYQIKEGDKDEKGNDKVIIRNDKMYVLLPESETEVTLTMIANVNDLPIPSPQTDKTTALNGLPTFNYDVNYMPMYGESAPFIVKEGAKPGSINLKRAMAKLEVDARNAWPLFQIESIELVNVNTTGTIVSSKTITNSSRRIVLSENLNSTDGANNNIFRAYMPEATDVNSTDPNIRTAIIMKGKNKEGEVRFYRLDFIKRTQVTGGSIEYKYINEIERNHKYVFQIEHIVANAGSGTREDAINKALADNRVNVEASLMVIDDENIRDITTDSQYYLGVTSANLDASLNYDGTEYVVNMSIVTSTPTGWTFEDLPTGVSVSISKQNDNNYEKATSVWIYLDGGAFNKGDSTKIYVYSGNIRKTITIHIV